MSNSGDDSIERKSTRDGSVWDERTHQSAWTRKVKRGRATGHIYLEKHVYFRRLGDGRRSAPRTCMNSAPIGPIFSPDSWGQMER